ncbi:MAG: LysR family transcriptional regulator, partial [Defluviicoccus sp.]|nr:LysR family transcriptional regulator [Defluviicoccus sp.]
MELRQLRYFCRVAEHRSFTAAARALNVSQPTLGVQVRKLEEELGLLLFRRHSRGVELTEAGSIYFSQIENVLRRLEVAGQSVDHLRTAPRQALRIGVIPSIGIAVMSTVLEAAESLVPDLEIS